MRSQAPNVDSPVADRVREPQGSMKLLPTPQRGSTDDSVGLGIEAAIVLALFLGVGYLIDRIVGTQPIFMVVMVVLGAVGLFAKLKYRYDDRMDALDERRRDAAASRRKAA
jgi:hypothetical protein